jgi:conjugal transfer pilus assembly protein TraW
MVNPHKIGLVALCITMLSGYPAAAQTNADLIGRTRSIISNSEAILGDDFAAKLKADKSGTNAAYEKLAREIVRDQDDQYARGIDMLKGTEFEAKDLPDRREFEDRLFDPNGYRYEVYLSRGMTETNLRAALKLLSGNPHSVGIFRGIAEGTKIGEGIRELHEMVRSLNPVPNLTIDPEKFKSNRIDQVPVVLAIGKNDQVVSRVEGTANPDWLANVLDRDETGDQGIVGQLFDISEPNLIDVMRARVMEIDWKEKTRLAKERFLSRLQFVDLPVAEAGLIQRIIPRHRLTRPISAKKYGVDIPAGTTFNPLDYHTISTVIFVFDAMDTKQVDFVARLARETAETRPVSLITTRIKRENGFEWLSDIETKIGLPVHLLKQDLANSLAVTHVPSKVMADGNELVITTYDREAWQ